MVRVVLHPFITQSTELSAWVWGSPILTLPSMYPMGIRFISLLRRRHLKRLYPYIPAGFMEMIKLCARQFNINMTQTMMIRDEGTSIEKMLPQDQAVFRFVGHFLN